MDTMQREFGIGSNDKIMRDKMIVRRREFTAKDPRPRVG